MMSEYNQTIGFFFVNKSTAVAFLEHSNIHGVFSLSVEYFDTLRIVFDPKGHIDHVIYKGDWHSVREYDVYNHNISMILGKWDDNKVYHLNLHPNKDDDELSLCYEEVTE